MAWSGTRHAFWGNGDLSTSTSTEFAINTMITCPQCRHEFEVTDAMRTQLTDQIRSEFELDAASRQAQLDAFQMQLDKEQADLDAARKALDERVRSQVEAARQQLLLDARQQAKSELSLELQDRDHQLTELQSKLKMAQDAELKLRERERKLHARTEELQLEVARQLYTERGKIRAEALRQSDQEHQLKDAEKEKQIADLRHQIDELKRKAEQGSQQLQGEVQELALEDLLQSAFPTDNITPVSKGVCGGDSLHQVLDPTGLSCGSILWESKRTKNWSQGWLAKLRDDQRAARTACAVIVSEALPDGVTTFALVDGVWVCSWSCIRPLASALRVGLIELAKSRLAAQGQHDKMEMVYNYLAGQEFRNRVAGIVEAFIAMREDLESEKRSMSRIWAKREKQLERASLNTAGMYGDLQGIIGASLPAIAGLSVPCLAAPGEAGHDERLEELAG